MSYLLAILGLFLIITAYRYLFSDRRSLRQIGGWKAYLRQLRATIKAWLGRPA